MKAILVFAAVAVCLFAAESARALLNPEEIMTITNDAGETVAVIDDLGYLRLKGTLTESTAIDLTDAVWTFTDDSGQVVAVIDDQGNMDLAGGLSEWNPTLTPGTDTILKVTDDAQNPVLLLRDNSTANPNLELAKGHGRHSIGLVDVNPSKEDMDSPLDEYEHGGGDVDGYDPVDGHSPGVVFTDLNGDDWPDIYLVRETFVLADGEGPTVHAEKHNKILLNVPDGAGGRKFQDVTTGTNSDARDVFTDPVTGNLVGRNGVGAIAADYDNDGDVDIYVVNGAMGTDAGGEAINEQHCTRRQIEQAAPDDTCFGTPIPLMDNGNNGDDEFIRNTLLRNDGKDGNGVPIYTDVTQNTTTNGGFVFDAGDLEWDASGNIVRGKSISAVWADFNRDGWIDLYVANHRGHNVLDLDEDPMTPPDMFHGMRNSLYLNVPNPDGGRHFIRTVPEGPWPRSGEEIAHIASVRGGPRELEPDMDSSNFDGPITDQRADDLFEIPVGANRGWDSSGPSSGSAAGAKNGGSALASIACDFNNDRWPDLYVANGDVSGDPLYINRGGRAPAPVSSRLRFPSDRSPTMSWSFPNSTKSIKRSRN